uniref:ABC transporter ATP-binding protein n=1 Tax=Desulfacinum infernum TaxID=35837 RepID=A0A831ZZF4_9BACT
MPEPMIAVEGLRKRFGTVDAVAGISFHVAPGELFGFLGPNGAGKTTTINMLTGLARPDAGSIRIAGVDCSRHPKAAQPWIGVVPDESNLYPELSGFQNLCFCGALYGLTKRERERRAWELLEAFDLMEAAHRKFAGYSKGMKRKLTLAAGILHKPAILFLDEPTTGIDVASARHVRRLVADLHQRGTTIFLTTHYIEEAERLCQRIAFIVSGRIVRTDTVAELLQPVQDRYVLHVACAQEPPAHVLESLSAVDPSLGLSLQNGARLRVEAAHAIRVGPLVRILEDHGIDVLEARLGRPSLEDVFVAVTGLAAEALKKEKEKPGGGSAL